MDSWMPPRQAQGQGKHAAWFEGYRRGPWREVYHGPPPPHFRHTDYHPEFQVGPQPWLDIQTEHHHPIHHSRFQNSVRPNSRAEYYKSSYPDWSYTRQGYEEVHRGFVEDHGAYQRFAQTHPSERDPRWRDNWSESANSWNQNYHRDYQPKGGTDSLGYYDAVLTQSKKQDSYEESYASKKDTSYDISYRSPLLLGQTWDEFQENILENATVPAHELSLPEGPIPLQQYKESGLSSSSYELRHYMENSSNHYEATLSKDWNPIQLAEDVQAMSNHVASPKFTLPHVPLCFGAGGQLVRGCPNDPADGQPALVEIHSLEIILHDTAEQETMRIFPGPLIREDLHKVDVVTFCQRKAATGCDLTSKQGRDSALLWKLLLLLCRQNGSMVGSDTAELLMQNCKYQEKYKRQEPRVNLINLTDEEWPVPGCGTMDLLTGEIVPNAGTPEQIIGKFTKLLFYGRKKEALDWAMRNQLWGHALFLSSKMNPRTYSWVLSGFTSTLASNDPLQTLFQLMSGRIPQASLCCGDDKWGDWRPHLAVMLSNQVGDLGLNSRAIITMGDTLAGKGLIEAAHFCYLMANVPFGHYRVQTDYMVLLGSSQSQTFSQFARTECIHRTEILEYCRLLGCSQAFIPSFQVYKLIYASRLADYGLTAQALHYCEGAGMALLAQNQNIYPVLLEQVIKLAERLKFSDPRLLEKAEYEMDLEPDWLIELRARYQQWEEERELPNTPSTQPEAVRGNGSISGLAPHFEFAQAQVCQENLEHHPSGHLPPVNSTQHQPDVDQQLHMYPGDGHSSDKTDATLETYLAGNDQGFILSSESLSSNLSSHLNQPPGETVESCGQGHFPGDPKKHIPEHQTAFNVRTRTISESSTISMAEDAPPSPEGSWDEASSEKKLVENTGQEVAKTSGFGWLRWFRSKANNDGASSEKVPTASLDSTAPVSQEKTAQPVSVSPMNEAKPASLHCPPPLSHTEGNPFSKRSPEAQNPQGHSSLEAAVVSDAGYQINSFRHQYNPDSVPLFPTEGAVPLFNPAQVTTPAASGTGHLQRSFQKYYPQYK
ncbi:protein transport protein Sec16B isoform X1 [Python bivittatus]|uniref:Protein transport protein Sec16B n=1 Tax=Python bivittatus TaxID=176946 RepID=A0A9F5IZC9_PYTBI|nr:protein transport protein Sec16B isoform X1 [Python bivittatus]XP_025024228.1 protein transport protein Sec16B isoform X1 [Python bivittatus]XP_025024229.1 protein transport protein Sec16B isoform X1 [Python bivittatus]